MPGPRDDRLRGRLAAVRVDPPVGDDAAFGAMVELLVDDVDDRSRRDPERIGGVPSPPPLEPAHGSRRPRQKVVDGRVDDPDVPVVVAQEAAQAPGNGIAGKAGAQPHDIAGTWKPGEVSGAAPRADDRLRPGFRPGRVERDGPVQRVVRLDPFRLQRAPRQCGPGGARERRSIPDLAPRPVPGREMALAERAAPVVLGEPPLQAHRYRSVTAKDLPEPRHRLARHRATH